MKVCIQNKIMSHSNRLKSGFVTMANTLQYSKWMGVKACQEYVLNVRNSSQSIRLLSLTL
jgi:hypothetical protein